MNSLDGAHRASPAAFFFTRLQARLQQQSSSAWDRMTGWIARPAVAITGLCLILLANGFIVAQQLEDHVSGTDQVSMQAFADEYSLQVTTFYDDDKTGI